MADCKRKTANLFDGTYTKGFIGTTYIYKNTGTGANCAIIPCEPSTTYTVKKHDESNRFAIGTSNVLPYDEIQLTGVYYVDTATEYTFTTDSSAHYMIVYVSTGTEQAEPRLMVNTGTTALPYEPHGWVHSLRKLGTATDTITTLPAVIYADGNNATVGISGNTVQSGTPTPTNPIQPSECGEKTAQLFEDKIVNCSIDATGGLVGNPAFDMYIAKVEQGVTYTASASITGGFYTTKPTIGSTSYNGQRMAFVAPTVTAPITGYMTFRVNSGSAVPMLNTGSTALPYEPYGVKIPILSNSTTTPVYLGEVESTRRIKKLVFNGTENWQKATNFLYLSGLSQSATPDCICSHYKGTTSGANYTCTMVGNMIRVYDSSYSTAEDFKTYLVAQYANGTPVTIWYVLASEETGIVNEPIMKIGDYADTVSGITIPTISGANSFDVLTTLKPSEVSLNYTGWHDAIVHVYPDSSWMPTSWEEFRKVVRVGKAQSLYPVGTKLYENWGDITSNAWIVVDYPTGEDYLDSDLAQQGYTNRVMLMEEKLNYLRQFDAIEAWLYVEIAIPAGTYRFTIPNYDTSYGGNKTYIFTSTADVPVGGQFTLTWNYQQHPSAVQAYSSSTSTSALFNVSITEWDSTTPCTDLGTIKLAMSDVDSTYGKLNHIHRARYGSNNYYQSGLRQWLNADATANNWWTPTNIFDRPYDNRSTAGRLNVLNSNMKAVLATPTVNCITNNLFEYPSLDGTTFPLQTAYTVKDKLFLVTHTETNLSSTPNVDSVLAYYTNAQNADRIKYRKDNGNAYYWWLRTPHPTYASYVRNVNTSGALNTNGAYSTHGSAAACIIQ